MAADEAHIVAKRQELGSDAGDKKRAVAVGKVGAADRAGEERVAELGEAGGALDEDDVTRGVAGDVQDVEAVGAELDRPALGEEAGWPDVAGREVVLAAHAFEVVEEEGVAFVGAFDGCAGEIVELGGAAGVIEMAVGQQDALDGERARLDSFGDQGRVAARIDDERGLGLGVVDKGAVLLKRGNGDDLDTQLAHEEAPFSVGSLLCGDDISVGSRACDCAAFWERRMDATGERRLPAARDLVWAALSDRTTLADSMPPGVAVEPHASGSEQWLLTLTHAGAAWRTLASSEPGGNDARSVLALARADGANGFEGRAEITMAEDGAFTRVFWRVTSDLPEEAGASVRDAVEHLLTQIGQRSARPVPVAADGAAGAAAALASSLPTGSTPLGAMLASLGALPRDSTIGAAAFVLVVLLVVGIL